MDPISVSAGLAALRVVQQRKAKRQVDHLSTSYTELADGQKQLDLFVEEFNEHFGELLTDHQLLVQEHLALAARVDALDRARRVTALLSACAALVAVVALTAALFA